MKKPFIVANVREITDKLDRGEITYSRMVEMLNEIADKFYEQKWISVEDKEQLPPKLKYVMVYYLPNSGYPIPVTSFHLGDGVSHSQSIHKNGDITHWMPLPDTPKTK